MKFGKGATLPVYMNIVIEDIIVRSPAGIVVGNDDVIAATMATGGIS